MCNPMKQSIFYLQRKQKFRVLCMVEKFNFIKKHIQVNFQIIGNVITH